MSGVRSLLKVAGAALMAHGATKSATIVNSEDAVGLALVVAGFAWSYFHHSDATTEVNK